MRPWNDLKFLLSSGAELTRTNEERNFFNKPFPSEVQPGDLSRGLTTAIDFNQEQNGTSYQVVPSRSTSRDESLAKVEVAVLAFVFVFALLGNIVVLMRITYLA